MSDFKEDLKDAICNNDVAFLKANLHQFSIDERFEDEDNDTLLLYALSDSGSEAYRFFLERNADITLLNDKGENVIHSIVYSDKVERLGHFLNSANINHQSKDGTTPLLLASGLEHTEMAKLLLQKGADVNISDKELNLPIHIACYNGDLQLVTELIAHGADLFKKTLKGNLPLAIAVNCEHHEVVKYLYNKIYSNS